MRGRGTTLRQAVLLIKPTQAEMEEYNSGEEVLFNADDASNNIKECIEGVIGGTDYSQSKVNQWTASIVEQSLTHLVKQVKPFKYIVNCTIMQKSGAGLHTANSCYWDNTTDGSCTVRWENRTMYCVVGVFAVALQP
ncbi:dynein light chain Tctex-type 1-like isoform X3 [Entelurus aequoreus]|uniref:dynein light chain Tctex-type 1-like isoform X2 n=1 Tax=Entelurus aequoreus TaxID=161455 RepID=UPI002B1E6A02|nr:dynein light chain Tctex-type 1-like isoform X2 [Entelurus aequoreus]XP_061925008.1 dynein light chain Tctex-type 1-like isoform X3 [Entelurus aequoreus]